jgi:hypothetical protein
VVVYSRCRVPRSDFIDKEYIRSHGCDLYRYSFATGREQKLVKLSGRSTSEVLPSIWGARVAFARVYEQRKGAAGEIPRLFVGNVRSGRLVPLEGGRRGVWYHDEGRPGPSAIDLRGRQVAYDWQYWPEYCGGVPVEEAVDGSNASELWVDTLGGEHVEVDARCEAQEFEDVSLDGTSVFYSSFGPAGDPNDWTPYIRRFDIPTGRYYEAAGQPGDERIDSDGLRTYAVRNTRSGRFVVRVESPVFQPLAGRPDEDGL